ncbi:substrate-binding domain-containing protein [Actinokineospora sp. NBRC 105648]|uniref:substrate-binding domain-containing protein n=1 Tax=Actinokineospora sp. NBRC 105648 TaxID=3032206 RepID=UPI0025571DD4|nr:substrate-binding domain-containing protein [Actinokineospora sp. NBRC 105648]
MRIAVLGAVMSAALVAGVLPAAAEAYPSISGTGSTAAFNLVDQWRFELNQRGLRVNYVGTGSTDGLTQFAASQTHFAATELTYPQSSVPPPARPLRYLPVAASATVLAVNLTVGGRKVTELRLSDELAAKVFTRAVTDWSDPAIAAENPGLALPSLPIVPVVRADSAPTTLAFTRWLAQAPGWDDLCPSCVPSTSFPSVGGVVAQSGSIGVTNYVRQRPGAISYVERSYALNAALPTVALANASGAYAAPDPAAVTAALASATSGVDGSVDYSPVLRSLDPAAYPLSGYTYLVVPTALGPRFTAEEGRALADFVSYAVCDGQQNVARLSFAPLPAAQARATRDQLTAIPGATAGPRDCAGPQPPARQDITTVVQPGELLISVTPGAVVLPPPAMTPDGAIRLTAGSLNPITVTDTRAGDPGWSVSGQVTDFTGTEGTIGAANLTWKPVVVDHSPVQVVTAGPPADLSTSRILATATRGAGTAHLTADVELRVATSVPAGTYSATLTLTVI